MEIRLQGTAIPCVAGQDIVAGLAVKILPAEGKSSPDVVQAAYLPGAASDTEARYVAAFRVYNEKPPIYEGLPTLDIGDSTQPYTLRSFVEGSENLPASVTLRMVPPRLKEEETILSGELMLAYDDGIYMVTSGCFVQAAYTVGAIVSTVAGGQWTLGSGGRVATVFEYDGTNAKLTLKTGR